VILQYYSQLYIYKFKKLKIFTVSEVVQNRVGTFLSTISSMLS